jgi:hypothetical protein
MRTINLEVKIHISVLYGYIAIILNYLGEIIWSQPREQIIEHLEIWSKRILQLKLFPQDEQITCLKRKILVKWNYKTKVNSIAKKEIKFNKKNNDIFLGKIIDWFKEIYPTM